MLFAVYAAFLVFKFYSHASVWGVPNRKVENRNRHRHVEHDDATYAIASIGANISATMGGQAARENSTREPGGGRTRSTALTIYSKSLSELYSDDDSFLHLICRRQH